MFKHLFQPAQSPGAMEPYTVMSEFISISRLWLLHGPQVCKNVVIKKSLPNASISGPHSLVLYSRLSFLLRTCKWNKKFRNKTWINAAKKEKPYNIDPNKFYSLYWCKCFIRGHNGAYCFVQFIPITDATSKNHKNK